MKYYINKFYVNKYDDYYDTFKYDDYYDTLDNSQLEFYKDMDKHIKSSEYKEITEEQYNKLQNLEKAEDKVTREMFYPIVKTIWNNLK